MFKKIQAKGLAENIQSGGHVTINIKYTIPEGYVLHSITPSSQNGYVLVSLHSFSETEANVNVRNGGNVDSYTVHLTIIAVREDCLSIL